jgi:hypothetical protein
VFGAAVLVGSITMDRLAQQNINPVTVPGLLPGLLGIAMILLGSVLGVRSLRRGALHQAAGLRSAEQREQARRVAVAIALCLGYGVVLVGHGILSGSPPASTSPFPSSSSSVSARTRGAPLHRPQPCQGAGDRLCQFRGDLARFRAHFPGPDALTVR